MIQMTHTYRRTCIGYYGECLTSAIFISIGTASSYSKSRVTMYHVYYLDQSICEDAVAEP